MVFFGSPWILSARRFPISHSLPLFWASIHYRSIVPDMSRKGQHPYAAPRSRPRESSFGTPSLPPKRTIVITLAIPNLTAPTGTTRFVPNVTPSPAKCKEHRRKKSRVYKQQSPPKHQSMSRSLRVLTERSTWDSEGLPNDLEKRFPILAETIPPAVVH